MTQSVEFLFDFASPNAYLAHKALPALLERTSASLVLTPCLLGGIFKATGNKPPFVAFEGVPQKLAYERKEIERFIIKHGLMSFKMNSHFPVNTLLMMRAAMVAERDGFLPEYVEAGLSCLWEKDLKMDDAEVFKNAMDAAGFDGAALLQDSQSPDIKAALAANTAQAVERGVFGIPSFFVGSELFFGKERLGQVEELLSASHS